jgi:hypothetical protein
MEIADTNPRNDMERLTDLNVISGKITTILRIKKIKQGITEAEIKQEPSKSKLRDTKSLRKNVDDYIPSHRQTITFFSLGPSQSRVGW